MFIWSSGWCKVSIRIVVNCLAWQPYSAKSPKEGLMLSAVSSSIKRPSASAESNLKLWHLIHMFQIGELRCENHDETQARA
jgi:hypothetical protein